MTKPELIIIDDGGAPDKIAQAMSILKDTHEVIVLSPEQAKERNLQDIKREEDFVEQFKKPPTPYIMTRTPELLNPNPKSGKDNRRERRAKERKKKH